MARKKSKNNNKYNDYDKEIMKEAKDDSRKSKSSTTGVPDLVKPRGTRHNDPNWYFSDTMKNTVANFAYTYPNGSTFDLELGGRFANRVPGILILQHMPAFGGGDYQGNSNTALNMAAHNIYSFVRHLNSGASNYDAPDLLIYILCVSQLYSAHSWMRRLYGLLRTYDANNWYKPEGIFDALGIDFKDFREHIVDFRAYINLYASKIATLKIPKDLGITKRHIWMYENIYKDEESVHAQLMLFEPDGFYRFNETNVESQTFGGAEYLGFYRNRFSDPTFHMTYAQMTSYMDALLNASFKSEDHNIMSGDIFKAYQGNCEEAYQIDESYVTEPVYEETFNLQVSNAVIGGCTASEGNSTWYNAGLVQNPTTGGLNNEIYHSYSGGNQLIRSKIEAVLKSKRFINQYSDNPSVDDNVEATRLIQIPRVLNAGGTAIMSYYEHAASGIIVNATVYYGVVDDLGDSVYRKTMLNSCYVYNSDDPADFINLVTALNMFRCKPCFYFTDDESTLTDGSIGYLNDLYTFTLIDKSTLDRMNDVAILGLLGIK